MGILILLYGFVEIVPGIVLSLIGKGGGPSPGYSIYIGEVLAPLLLIAGLWTRLAALVVVVSKAATVLLAHLDQFGQLSSSGG